jgi:DNA repair protein RecO (recombination protein O)
MALIDDEALVLDSQPYRDRHLLLTLLTRTGGVIRGVSRNARGGKTPQAAAAQILSLVHVIGYVGRGADLATFRRIDLLTSSYSLAVDLERTAAAAVVAELLYTFCPLEEPAPRRFRLGVSMLDGLLEGKDPDTAVAYAQFWSLALGGVLPDATEAEFDTRDLEFLAACRGKPLTELTARVTSRVREWLDDRVRHEAERPLRALDFLRTTAVTP